MPEAKIALVTGAGRGIGRDIALGLAHEGYACGLIARTKSQLDETADLIRKAGGKALVTPTDVSKREQVLAAVEAVERELGPISVLINNAGAYLKKPLPKSAKKISISSSRSIPTGRSSARKPWSARWPSADDGTIIFVLGSETRGGPGQYSAYTASKVAQRAIAESVAYEFMHRGIHAAALDVDGAVDSARVREAMPETDPSHFVSPGADLRRDRSSDQSAEKLVDLSGGPALVLAMASARRREKEAVSAREARTSVYLVE